MLRIVQILKSDTVITLVFLFLFISTAYSQDTATEVVAVSWSSTDDVLLLTVNNDVYDLSSTGLEGSTDYEAWLPGERATEGVNSDYGQGGVLNYTLHGQEWDHKITVDSSTASYNEGSLEVETLVLNGDGSDTGGMDTTGLGTAVSDAVPITNTPAKLIGTIRGEDTWTGTSGDPDNVNTGGAPLEYTLSSPPGVSNVTVTYTLLLE